MLRISTIVGLAAIATAGCASSKTAPEPAPMSTAPRVSVRRQANVITEQELSESTARNALQAVETLRPDWLRGRGAASLREVTPAAVMVYLENQRLGGIETLEQFSIHSIKGMRYYSASEATNRWGTGHGSGAIAVTTK